jgi:glycosyltransferase involved in cell wall biosynthesis
LEAFLNSLSHLKKETISVDYIFTDDNKDVQSSRLLEEFSPEGSAVTILQGLKGSSYVCNEESHHWSDALMYRVANYKNEIIRYAIKQQYDYLFFIDSDIIVHPDLLEHLKKAEKEIVSEIFWSKWHYNTPFEPNVWLFDEYDLVPRQLGEELDEKEMEKRKSEFLNQLKVPGLYKVGGLGACTLISRSALLKGVDFSPIMNLTIHGEDRFFCIRAEVLGIPLYVDTHFPAYHIYRKRDLPGVTDYIQQCKEGAPFTIYHPKWSTHKITLSMIVRNEEGRYLKRLLSGLKNCIDEAVIIDDASTDNTASICREELQGIDLHLITNEQSMFSNEYRLRKLQWEETVKTKPEWILNLDADEIIEPDFWKDLYKLLDQKDVNAYGLRLYDMWNDTQYRDDKLWNAHTRYHTVLIRYQPEVTYKWNTKAQHCGRFPVCEGSELITETPYRIQHFGWAREEDRLEKKRRYERLDPDAVYGIKEQYDSIMDSNPNLKEWKVYDRK